MEEITVWRPLKKPQNRHLMAPIGQNRFEKSFFFIESTEMMEKKTPYWVLPSFFFIIGMKIPCKKEKSVPNR